MGYGLPLLAGLVLLNLVCFFAVRWCAGEWVAAASRRRALLWMAAVFVLLNLPLAVFFYRPLDVLLRPFPSTIMETLFLPSAAWVMALLAFSVLAGFVALGWLAMGGSRKFFARGAAPAIPAESADWTGLLPARRKFIAGSLGLALPALYGVSAYGLRGALDELEISPELDIPIPHLPASLAGLRVVQLSDLHVGPYIRTRELESVVARVNALRPDLVVITGDLIDRDLASLPEAVAGMRGMRSTHGALMVLGNHDLYADQYSYTASKRGGVQIAEAMADAGIRTLRDEVATLEAGGGRLAVMGLDWIVPNRRIGNLFYDSQRTRQALQAMDAQIPPETPKLLLAHHPETFNDVSPFKIGLTLAGHTHGGGQIVLGDIAGQPVGVAMLRFHFLRGLYQDRGSSLYVHRGIGYLGLPIRINCPPEISQFRLVRNSGV